MTTSRKAGALSNTVFSALTTIVAIVNGIVLVPWYLTFISAEQYGVWLATGNVLAWLTIIDPGVGDLARQQVAMFYGARRWHDACSVIWSGGLIVAGMAVGIAFLAQVCAQDLVGFLRLSNAELEASATRSLAIAGIGTGLLFFAAFVGGVIQSLQRTFWVGWVTLAGTALLPVTRLLFLWKGMGLEGFAWGMVVQGLFVAVGSTALLLHRLAGMDEPFAFHFSQMRSLLGLSAYTSLQRVAALVGDNIRGVLVIRYVGPETNAAFEMTRAPLDMVRTFLDKPMSSFTPAFAHLKGEGDMEKISMYAVRFFAVFMGMLALCIAGYVTLNGAFIDLWLGEQFFLGENLNALLAASFALGVVINFARGFLYSMGDIQHVSLVVIVHAFATVAAQFVGLRFGGGLVGLVLLPIFINVGFCLLGFPQKIARTYVGPTASRRLLTQALVPGIIGAISAGAVGMLVLGCAGPVGWYGILAAALAETLVYLAVVLSASPILRREFGLLVSVAGRAVGWRAASDC